MKKLVFLPLLFAVMLVHARNYYVSNSGNDAAAGTIQAPWATLAKINSSMGTFLAGDSILFQRGGSFAGTLTVSKGGIVFSAYGVGVRPVLTGFYSIPSWTSIGSNRWTATVPSGLNNVRLLTLNDRVIRVGRFPDYEDGFSAWLRYSNGLAAVSPISVTATQPVATNLADGELVLFKNNWNLDVMPINSISGNTINCTNPAGMYGITANGFAGGNWGFFVQNSINALNVQNEWHYSNATKVLTLYSTVNPSTLGVFRIPVQTNIVLLGSTSNITIDNLDIQGCSEKAIVSTGGSNQTIKNCIVRFAQGWGIELRSTNAVIQNNLVRDIGSNGIWVSRSATITANVVKTCGNIEGLAGLTNSGAGTQGNQDNQHTGIEIETGDVSNGSPVVCRMNKIDSTGYAGIRYYGSNILIEKNVITYPCIAKSDGGGIYSWDQDGGITFINRRVKNNMILNSGKFLYGTSSPGLNTQGYGIYCDAGTSNVLIDSNVIGPSLFSPNASLQGCSPGAVTNTADDGAFYLNGGKNLTVRGNVVYGWPNAIMYWRYGNVANLSNVTGIRIVGNALYVNGGGTNLCSWNKSFVYHTYDNSSIPQIQAQIQNLGVIDSNYVSNFAPSPYMYKGDAVNPGGPVKLAQWQSFSGKSTNDVPFQSGTPTFVANPTDKDTTIYFVGFSKKDYQGRVYNNQATVPAFYANIFFDNGLAPIVLPVTLVEFTARKDRDNINMVSWKTANEQNSSYFAIERSGDGRSFVEIGRVTSNNRGAEMSQYNFSDAQPLFGANYYRLKMFDRDGSFRYSSIVLVGRKVAGSVQIEQLALNATSNSMIIGLSTDRAQRVNYSLVGVNGVVLSNHNVQLQAGFNKFISNPRLSSALYYVRVATGDEIITRSVLAQ